MLGQNNIVHVEANDENFDDDKLDILKERRLETNTNIKINTEI